MGRPIERLIKRCHILHVEPNAAYSSTIDGMLRRNGAASVVHVTSYRGVNRQTLNGKTDVLILDHDEDFEAAEYLVRRVRRVKTGADPFLAIFASQSTASEQTVRKEKSAGFDGILLKPFSLDTLFSRIENVANSDRREKNRTDPNSEVYDAPNRLKIKMTKDVTPGEVRKWRKFWTDRLAGPDYFDV